jgi:hypothetical protein
MPFHEASGQEGNRITAPMEVSSLCVQFLKEHPFTACPCKGTGFPMPGKKSEGDLDNPKKVIIISTIYHKSRISAS